MKSILIFITYILVAFFAISCNNSNFKPEKTNTDPKNGFKQYYYPNGNLRLEATLKDGKKEGIVKQYYKDGSLHTVFNYIADIKNGSVKWYYKSGKLYNISPFVNGTKHGIQKRYYESGVLKSEQKWHNGYIVKGLKEYTEGGNLIPEPKLFISEKNTVKMNNVYKLIITSDSRSKKIDYAYGNLSKDKTLLGDVTYLHDNKGVGEFQTTVYRGDFLMKKLNFIAKIKSKHGNYYLIEKKFNLAVQN